MNRLSAVIIAQDEARNIGRCLASLQGVVDEIIVVDSGSTDATESICLQHGARFVSHPWQGYAEQKNYADSLATNPWILSIDADEALSDELRASLSQLMRRDLSADRVFSMRRLNNYCGTWIHHSGWYPDEKVRLWHNGCCSWDGLVHETLVFAQPVTTERLQGHLLHYTYYSVQDHAARQVRYAGLAAEKAFRQGRRASCCSLWIKPFWTFLRNYLFKGGFLDGRAGFQVCKMSAFYSFLKQSRLRELMND